MALHKKLPSGILMGIMMLVLYVLILSGCSSNTNNDLEEVSVFNFSSAEEFGEFKQELVYLDGIAFEDEKFMSTLDIIFDNNTMIYNSAEISLEEFMEISFFDHSNFLYVQDLNNDGEEDILILSKFAGSGNFSSITNVFLRDGSRYEHQNINEENMMLSDLLEIVSYQDKNYIFTTSQWVDNVVEWQDNGFIIVFDERKFVESDRLDADYSELNKNIYETYNIAEIENEMLEKEMDFSVTGYSNEEILLSFYKIKDFVKKDKKEDLANMISFPIVYTKDNKEIKIYNRAEFIEQYNDIVTENIKKIASESTYENIFTSWRGAMIGTGEIWFANHIYAIN